MGYNIEKVISDALTGWCNSQGERDCEFISLLSQRKGPIGSLKVYTVRVFFRKKGDTGKYKKILECDAMTSSYEKVGGIAEKVTSTVIIELLKNKEKLWNLISTKPQ